MDNNNSTIIIDKNKLIDAIIYNLEQFDKMIGANHSFIVDYDKQNILIVKGMIFTKVISDKTFDEFIKEFLEKDYG